MSTTPVSTIAGLPQFMTLRARDQARRCLHFLWFDESYPEFHKRMGVKRVVDEVSPFAKIEVVPSTTDPSSLIHLRSSHNGKYCELIETRQIFYLSATADSPEEDRSKPTCTLFQRVFAPDQPNVVYFVYVPNKNNIHIMSNTHYSGYQVACVYDQKLRTLFEFAPWESYEERMKAKGEEIEKLKDEVGAKDEEIEKLKAEVGAKDKEIEKLKGEVGAKDEEIETLKGQVHALEVYEEERKAILGEEMVKLESVTTSAWQTFKEKVMVVAAPSNPAT